ncbi:helix-turn-helix domain-containing protein [Paenibacillus mucilaginosus]|uniref:Transcriptional regulator, AraC family n=1 Tax=Paenibacillus mucilaginosus (strain KNP414) TaxID=1036673 RepID=F8FNZ5_PAEMK|nr:AraC family transcriptional regulator [Paenibacillus mucilaginosus]AEI45774.1 transcriptional regulator, AraC family [Paenibacillus mucilaginosus KNP414]MCG7215041.1 AraC family transcriptional regulator [Paenibacillus mucilaginosus]WDM27150.1 helix-turn-helix transcriptional regulator [Paenibacillus mucilaginosus]
MEQGQLQIMRSYLDNVQMTLDTVHYTKVGTNWRYRFENPEENRFYFIREGSGWIRLRGRLHHPKPGELLLLPAGAKLELGLCGEEERFGKYWCHFGAKVGDVHLFQMLDLPFSIRVGDEDWLERQFRALEALYRSPSLTAPLRIKSVLLELVSYYMEEALRQQDSQGIALAPSAAEGKITAVLHYIDTHLSEGITVEELARQMHFHPNYFMPYFKTMMGLSPIAYITRKRMDKAKELLRDTEVPVTEVAEAVGLELAYFSRLFKKQTALSPTQYRRNARGPRPEASSVSVPD